MPIILLPIPMQKLSKERAKPKNKASLESIDLELSKSEDIGFFIILIVIPKYLIKKLYIFCLSNSSDKFIFLLCLDSFFKASKQIKIPIKISIKFPIILVIISGNISFNILPNQIEKMEMIKEMKNKIILARLDILVFLIPYVIPIPRESILLEIANIKELTNIKTPLKT